MTDILNRCSIDNTTERPAHSLRRGDIICTGMGGYEQIEETAAVSDTMDAHTMRWVRTSTLQGLLPAGTVRTHRYEQDDTVLTVNR